MTCPLRATTSAAGPFWEPCWHLGSALGGHFGISGAPWEAILAPRDHTGKRWDEQDGHEVANDRLLVDFGMICGVYLYRFFGSKMLKNRFVFKLAFMSFFQRFLI